MKVLVGHTGFVGSNLYKYGQFDMGVNSKTVTEAYGKAPELMVYAGLRAEKYLANIAPEQDYALIEEAKRNIESINPRKLVLISTIDVYKNPVDVDEETEIITEGLHPYGLNRYKLECWVRENYTDALIIRLPALFGENIKKNFIYDFINIIPFILKPSKMEELCKIKAELREYYVLQENGFYKCKELLQKDNVKLQMIYKKLGFSALNFTDSRSTYQFYPLSRLWDDIQVAIKNSLTIFNPATEPITAGELYFFLSGIKFNNELQEIPVKYNYKTKYAKFFNGIDNYILNKEEVLVKVEEFIKWRIVKDGK